MCENRLSQRLCRLLCGGKQCLPSAQPFPWVSTFGLGGLWTPGRLCRSDLRKGSRLSGRELPPDLLVARLRLAAPVLPRPAPNNPVQVHEERFVLYPPPRPAPRARPAVVFRSGHHSWTDRVQVDVIHLLHEKPFAEHRQHVRMVIHQRVLVAPAPRGATQFSSEVVKPPSFK